LLESVTSDVTEWIAQLPETAETSRATERLTAVCAVGEDGRSRMSAFVDRYSTLITACLTATPSRCNPLRDLDPSGGTFNNRVTNAFIEFWPTVSHYDERMAVWDACNVAGEAAGDEEARWTDNLLSAMIAITAAEAIVTAVLHDAYDERVERLQQPDSADPATTLLLKAARSKGGMSELALDNLRYVTGWLIRSLTRTFERGAQRAPTEMNSKWTSHERGQGQSCQLHRIVGICRAGLKNGCHACACCMLQMAPASRIKSCGW
jgi:hypothetical protein